MKQYYFIDNSYWFSNGCSCCEDTYMETYNSEDTDCNLGSADSIESYYVQAIISRVGRHNVSDDYEEYLWEMSLKELEQEAANLNIEVVIEGGYND